MILKKSLSDCIIIRKGELRKDLILENDSFKVCTGCVDQYIVTDDNRLYGIISSFDIEREIGEKGDLDIESVINRDPISVVQSQRFEKTLVEHIFAETYRVRSVPIVDRNGEIQYVYAKVNFPLQKFVEQNFPGDVEQYLKVIKREISSLEKKYKKGKVYILSDFEKYGLSLGGIKEYWIEEKDINFLESNRDIVLLVYLYDFNCMKIIKKVMERGIRFIGSNYTNRDITAEVVPYFKTDENAKNVLEEEAFYNANYFDLNDFQNIFQALRMTEKLSGCYLEIGTYRGDSARAALSYMKKSGIVRKAYFLDTYEGFTYAEAEKSSDCDWVNTHSDTSVDFVNRRLQEFSNYQLIKANIIADELPDEVGNIAVCNIDVDMYEAVAAALEKVSGRILPGGIIIAEDFGHTPALFGAQYAVLEFMALYNDKFYSMYLQSGQYIMIKK